tara:strand:- start:1100 stop:1339 length:240 start_codon:yes stop_codon:yes gene_type:complete
MKVYVLEISNDKSRSEPSIFLFSNEEKVIDFIITYFDIDVDPKDIKSITEVYHALYNEINQGLFDDMEPYFDTYTKEVR